MPADVQGDQGDPKEDYLENAESFIADCKTYLSSLHATEKALVDADREYHKRRINIETGTLEGTIEYFRTNLEEMDMMIRMGMLSKENLERSATTRDILNRKMATLTQRLEKQNKTGGYKEVFVSFSSTDYAQFRAITAKIIKIISANNGKRELDYYFSFGSYTEFIVRFSND